MTNEEIWLYKKAQNGGKSDPNNTTTMTNVAKSISIEPELVIEITKITE